MLFYHTLSCVVVMLLFFKGAALFLQDIPNPSWSNYPCPVVALPIAGVLFTWPPLIMFPVLMLSPSCKRRSFITRMRLELPPPAEPVYYSGNLSLNGSLIQFME